jgi:hypothetical protein
MVRVGLFAHFGDVVPLKCENQSMLELGVCA